MTSTSLDVGQEGNTAADRRGKATCTLIFNMHETCFYDLSVVEVQNFQVLQSQDKLSSHISDCGENNGGYQDALLCSAVL